MTKIDIISGFLGAGKTTFIKKLLEEARTPALGQVRMDLTIAAIAKAENIEVSDEEVEAEFAKMADQYGMDVEKVFPTAFPTAFPAVFPTAFPALLSAAFPFVPLPCSLPLCRLFRIQR